MQADSFILLLTFEWNNIRRPPYTVFRRRGRLFATAAAAVQGTIRREKGFLPEKPVGGGAGNTTPYSRHLRFSSVPPAFGIPPNPYSTLVHSLSPDFECVIKYIYMTRAYTRCITPLLVSRQLRPFSRRQALRARDFNLVMRPAEPVKCLTLAERRQRG